MTALQSPAETIEIRDALAEWVEAQLAQDSRITLTHDTDHIHYDFADDLIRSGWVIDVPEERE